MTADPAAD